MLPHSNDSYNSDGNFSVHDMLLLHRNIFVIFLFTYPMFYLNFVSLCIYLRINDA